MAGISHFFAYLARMKFILRWNIMRNTQAENIQEHSLQVAMVAHGLAVIRKRVFGGDADPQRVMALAVFHEVGEVITGDLATPIKYFNPQIKDAYGQLEAVACNRLFEMIPQELREEYRSLLVDKEGEAENWQLVKAADKLCAYLKCVEELKAGNQEFARALKSIEAELKGMGLEEVEYFLERFGPSFSLTLDELN